MRYMSQLPKTPNYVLPFCEIFHDLQIQMGFLMVGHTHEDIDQGFSCLSRHLRKNDALTMNGMCVLHFIYCYSNKEHLPLCSNGTAIPEFKPYSGERDYNAVYVRH